MVKEKSCLITQQLLNSVDWFLVAPDIIIKPEKGGDGKQTWKEKAKIDLINLLERKPGDFPESAKRGIAFEKAVYKYANLIDTPSFPADRSDHFKTICRSVKGFDFFKKGKKQVMIDGHDCFFFTKYDALLPTIIKDIKTTEKYKSKKYLSTVQHKVYCYVSSIPKFEYVIAEWAEKYPEINGIYSEPFEVDSFELLEKDIFNKVINAFDIFKSADLWKTYRETFCLY